MLNCLKNVHKKTKVKSRRRKVKQNRYVSGKKTLRGVKNDQRIASTFPRPRLLERNTKASEKCIKTEATNNDVVNSKGEKN